MTAQGIGDPPAGASASTAATAATASPAAAGARLATVALLVSDYDAAIAFFTQALGFTVTADVPQGGGKRWVVVAPPGGDGQPGQGAALLLARAATPAQQAQIGRQGGGRVWLFLHTDDFARDQARLRAHGAHFTEAPRREPYGTVAVFEDPWGNRWDLIEPA